MAGSVLQRGAAEPLWRQLRTDLIRRIDAHEFADEFPGEHQLAQAYQVSRQTVRLALRDLRTSGVISAERGRHPRVQHPITQPMGAVYSLFSSVRATGMSQRSVVIALDERRDAPAAAQLGLAATDPLIYLERQRLANDEPLAWDRVWLPAALARTLLEVDFTDTSVYLEMNRRLGRGPTGGREEIGCRNATAEQARLLGIGESEAVLSLRRLGCHHGQPVEYRETLVRGDQFSLLAQFSPGSGYFLDGGTGEPAPLRAPGTGAPDTTGPTNPHP